VIAQPIEEEHEPELVAYEHATLAIIDRQIERASSHERHNKADEGERLIGEPEIIDRDRRWVTSSHAYEMKYPSSCPCSLICTPAVACDSGAGTGRRPGRCLCTYVRDGGAGPGEKTLVVRRVRVVQMQI
jgi:hypothetical protein